MHRAGTTVSPPDTHLIDALTKPGAFDHETASIELIETHISWVILTDDWVYKIKKPVVLDFLDFGDLDSRRFYCQEEIRLNKPWAPDLYVDVVPVVVVDGQPRFGGAGTPVEYAVRMRRFDEELRVDKQLERDELTVEDMRELGRVIAARHRGAQIAEPKYRRRVISLTKRFMWDNFAALEGFIDEDALRLLSDWTKSELARVDSLLERRFDDGFVRDCHGDLHLANLVRLPGGIATFDCIEFNTDLRRIDVVCDIAFLVMDLVARRRHDLAAHFLNRYLERSGDYGGVTLLDLYFVYRCLVRAKVAVIGGRESDSDGDRQAHFAEARRYCDIAGRQISRPPPLLVVMSGLSGSGKTRVSAELMAAMPAVRVRSDVERKRQFGLGETEDSESGVGEGIYSASLSTDVYEHLCGTARTILESGHNAIIDAAFLHVDQRDMALRTARDCGCAAVILQVEAPPDVLRERLRRRAAEKSDASEADLAVLEHQLATAEALEANEKSRTVVCDNTNDIDIAAIVGDINSKRAG